jgi:hypothetical protein
MFGMLLFYVLAGLWRLTHAYGYQPWAILVALTARVAWQGRAPGLTLLLCCLAVYALHGLTSNNLWDYLFDPVLMIMLGVSVIRPLMSRRKIRTQS